MQNPFSEPTYQQRTHARDTDIRGVYFRDQTAIIHSQAFRRLKHKAQVFFSPGNDHVCTRIEHVLHVATIAATICKGLNLNGWNLEPDMAYAIGLGHDLGHAPFGHAGENALNKKLGNTGTFIHEINSYRVVEHLANDGMGLNLCFGVKDGIINHNGEKFEKEIKPSPTLNVLENITNRKQYPCSYEGCIARFSDKIAYLGRDIEDALTAGFINITDVPEKIRKELGSNNGEIINTLILDLVNYSKNKDVIGFSDEKYELMKLLKDFNYSTIYRHPVITRYEAMCNKIVGILFEHLMQLLIQFNNDYPKYALSELHIDRHFGNYLERMETFYVKEMSRPEQIVTDYVSGMTDNYALDCIKQITIPEPIKFI